MDSREDALLQSEAFSLEEIFESDITNEENKSIIDYLRQVQNERNQLPSTVSVRSIKAAEQQSGNNEAKSNSMHEIFLVLDKYKEINLTKYNCSTWKEDVVHYVRSVRKYIHRKYNRKIIDGFKYHSAKCAVLSKLKKKENLISVFSSSPLCIHLYIYGINYKQVVHYLHVIASHLVYRKEEHSWMLYVWIIYLLILLDSLQALDSSVSSDLQTIKRACAERGETVENHNALDSSELTFLTHFYCNSPNGVSNTECSSHCPQSIYYIIYYLITEIFNQK
ncbi:conserved Plasmodium protein, unknown function [Plasmodium knowlesi strain H]|uniref:Uncharacterized protein n=3 Tax=Plasmodium knowlesi TaxID=5850 RepID=A0A5K1TUV1_PLAKH|nr:conserved Plasmodium protein, unknown function [Plasmodium knowlesi strain H]OTN64848.1 Uncharacterized protein PKNOH_S120146700 [Plasmodium knowlesi]CAA9988324.1 conserved Plasmodium protein, unknown function [Plasmodium knowlesi strain H]SBO20179.1 conserved Plasmodium protein, unknown function [Plasmodium knowlesi strain H]SBO20274.1 conserved Plasmodium protein, unknown function [Plasmodium knowlesi strain H]VVS77798.1 conserved Plasmodium protein, unknown function [Plasmodium knowlesi |eukprot:XP_002259303.1 hypothetical protein, conserved in Plasmodium species [Plasmodium knowlesi strain H]